MNRWNEEPTREELAAAHRLAARRDSSFGGEEPWWQNVLMFLAVLPTVGGLVLLALHLLKVILLDILPHLVGG